MDEPENHLHPSAVIELLDTIRSFNPKGQIWIATHSIPLLSHFEASSLWFVEGGAIKHSGRKPEQVLRSLLGSEEAIQKLKDFASLPAELARNRFAFECLCPPQVVETDSRDPQSKQLYDRLKIIWKGKESINLLDFGAGKGRMIANLADYENVSPNTLNYHAFDPSNLDREHCLKNIALSYRDEADRYHNTIDALRSKVDDNYFDVVVLSNVLHEIPHQDWCDTFYKIKKLLKSDAYVLLIEDCRIPTGELAHQNGFIVLSTLHLKKLFNIPATDPKFIAHDARFDSDEQRGRLMAHLIPTKYLESITSETIKESLIELKNSAKEEVRSLRKKESNYLNGVAHSFWIQQLANAMLCLTEYGND
jgi:SAM-dependent methyltransferase